MNRHARPHPEADAGFTIIELVLVVVILGIVGTGLTAAAVSTLRAGQRVDVMTTDQGSARISVSVMTRDLRTAAPVQRTELPAIMIAERNRIEFTGFLGSSARPEKIRIYVDPEDGTIVEDTIAPNAGSFEGGDLDWDDADAEIRQLTSFYANRDGEPLFTYYDHNGDELDPGTGRLTVEQARTISEVEIFLAVSSDPIDRVQRYVIQSRVRLPNAGIGARS